MSYATTRSEAQAAGGEGSEVRKAEKKAEEAGRRDEAGSGATVRWRAVASGAAARRAVVTVVCAGSECRGRD